MITIIRSVTFDSFWYSIAFDYTIKLTLSLFLVIVEWIALEDDGAVLGNKNWCSVMSDHQNDLIRDGNK